MATVSLALRHSPKIRETTAERVREAAGELGYTPSPLVAALMAKIRSAKPTLDITTIGILDLKSTGDDDRQPVFYREIFNGARDWAQRLGFHTEVFRLREKGMTPQRLKSIMLNRGIQGLLVPPYAGMAEELPFDLNSFSVVLIGNAIQKPHLHRVRPAHFQGITLAFDRLRELGYTRIGLIIDEFTDRRVGHKWSAGLHWYNAQPGVKKQIPILMDDWAPDEPRPLMAWVNKHRPDVVLSPRPRHLKLLKAEGLKVPEDIGFCLLNHADQMEPVTGLDQRPREIGVAALDALISQLHRNERGVPAVPITVSIEMTWVEGPTTREQNRTKNLGARI